MNFKQVFKYTKYQSVLYVEDEDLIREHTVDIFNTFFNSVEEASDGLEGLEKYKENENQNGKFFDLVVTDIMMPNMDGLTMIKEIMKLNPEQHIIVTSAHNESNLLIDLIQQGITNFIMKPFVTNQLLNILYKTCKDIYLKKENIRLEIEKHIQEEQKNTHKYKMLAMSDMIDNIAHQYRQPLTIISTIASGMKIDKEMGNFNEDILIDNCEQIEQNAKYLSQVIDDFNIYIKDEGELEKFDVVSVMEDMFEKLSRLLEENSIDVVFNFEENIYILSNPRLFSQAFLNMILNAVDVLGSKKGKKYIFINIHKNKNNCIIELKDNAGGIKDEIISKIFEIYFTTKHNYLGTGLGLYITYNIINRQLGGIIEVNNEDFLFNEKELRGANFRVTLPISSE